MAELSVELKAEIKDLEKKLDIAEKKLKDLGQTADEAGDKLKEGGKKGDEGFKKTGESLKNATIAGVGLSVIAVEIFRVLSKLGNQGNALSDSIARLEGSTNKLALAKRNLLEASNKEISSVKAEIAVLNSLLQIGRDETKSKQERQKAINKINKEYDKLLPNITNENIGTKEVIQSVTKLSGALIRQAKIRGAQNLIAKETEKLLEIQSKTALDAANAWDFLLAGRSNAALTVRGLQRQNKEIGEAEERIKTFTALLQKLLGEDIALDGVFTKVAGNIKKGYLSLSEQAPSGDVLAAAFGITDEAAEALGRKAEKIAFRIGNSLRPETFIKPKKLEERLTEMQRIMETFQNNMANLRQDALADGIFNIGQDIGQALAQGGNVIGAIGQSILSSFGGFLSSFGNQLVQYGVAALAFSTVSKGLLNPLTAGPSAIAAIAIGTALSIAGSALSSIGSGGLGGSSVGGQGSTDNISQGSTSSFGTSANGVGRVVFEIKGTKLIGVLNNTLDNNQRLGGNLSFG